MFNFIISSILIILAAIACGEMERLAKGRGLNLGQWWVSGSYGKSFLTKYIFSFLIDGWHFCKSVMIASLSLAIAIWTPCIYSALFFYILFGIAFSFYYHR
jgi:hypothetical protein